MKKKEKYVTASITVEASYIMPIILSIIFAIMIASFYFYDAVMARAVLEKNIAKFYMGVYEANIQSENFKPENN